MEKTEKIDISKRPNDKRNIGGSSCGFWFLGNEESADKDLKEKFEIVDEENQDNK